MKSIIKRFVPAILLVALVMMMALPECTHATPGPSTIIVPVDYPSISSAIANAAPGDTILVQSGTYYENPVINIPLTLQGENSANTVVVGTGNSQGASVFTIASNNVKISGFTVTSLNYSTIGEYADGILIEANNCVITGNNVVNTLLGIFALAQSSLVISQNYVAGNHIGILTFGGFNNTIADNNMTGSGASAIALEGYSCNVEGNNLYQNVIGLGLSATYSTVFQNNMTDNSQSGIYLTGANNVITANYISENENGIYSVASFGVANNNTIFQNNFVNNLLNANSTSPFNIQTWEGGNPLEGNYWSDYPTLYPNAQQIGNSGIMNLPYLIDANNTDKEPLMAPIDLSTAAAPAEPTPPTIGSNNIAAQWNLASVEPNDVTPDSTGVNPAVLGSDATNVTYAPSIVKGKFGEALYFNGNAYAFVPPSPTLTIPSDMTIDAWVNVGQFKNVTYNNIVIGYVSTTAKFPTRIFGFAINGVAPTNSTSPALGILRGYVTTDTGGFNEIDTTTPLDLNTWYHVVFTRSTQTGMHIYVNGVEQNVTIFAGTQNPSGSVEQISGLFIGHDSITTLEDVKILNVASQPTGTSIVQLWWFWTVIAAALATIAVAVYFVSKNGIKQNTTVPQQA